MQKRHYALKTCLISAIVGQLCIVSLLVGSVSMFRFEGCFLESVGIGSLDAVVSANIFTMSLDETARGFPEKTSQ